MKIKLSRITSALCFSSLFTFQILIHMLIYPCFRIALHKGPKLEISVEIRKKDIKFYTHWTFCAMKNNKEKSLLISFCFYFGKIIVFSLLNSLLFRRTFVEIRMEFIGGKGCGNWLSSWWLNWNWALYFIWVFNFSNYI